MNSLDIVVAFGGGIFGAAVGALAAFEFVGLLVIAMTVVQIITGASSDFITFPFGLFGPHTGGFAAGVAATAYAAKKGKLGSGRDITAGLSGLAAYDVLLVGGFWGGWLHHRLGVEPDSGLPVRQCLDRYRGTNRGDFWRGLASGFR